ncbi:Flp pilus assembly complex ATPase component TadA [Candidatus Saccharibacteria bacterium]|nr:Flp pilus assembly complex ATPase component TadA [Candidatus Saccharibacteria bacterium]
MPYVVEEDSHALAEESKIQQARRDHEEKSTAQRAALLGLPYLDAREFEEKLDLVREGMMTVKEMHEWRMVPLQMGSEYQPYRFGATSNTPESVLKNIRQKYSDQGREAQIFLITNSGFMTLMNRYDPPKKVIYDDITIAKSGDSTTIEQVSKTLNSVGSDQILDYLIDQADRLGASDIHVENQRNFIRIRMRVDGALHPVAEINKDKYRILMGAIGSRANISSAANTSQSGHIQKDIHREGATHLLNIRIETVPSMYGQDAVMRLFNFDESMLNLDLLGIPAREMAEIKEITRHPRGMMLMVGPTGSGKSTTLYSMLNALNNSERKILTLEDPIEYGISGITQIPVDTTHGQTFADGLRSILRMDPDVVMLGEIRDVDTAKTAIQASITGHLVLSSFHANSTAAAFSRMIGMIGINPIFSSAIRLLIAQRLVRKLYDGSKQEYVPDEATQNWIRKTLEGVSPERMEGVDLNNIKLWKPVIHPDAPFGYKGRIVIMEQMVVNHNIQAFLRGDISDANPENIEKEAKQSAGLITLIQAGTLAALRGETTLEEVNKSI